MVKNNHYEPEKQTVFTKFAYKNHNPEKLRYGIIETKSKSLIVEFTSRFRSEARRYFEKQAKLQGGELTFMKAYWK